MDKAPRVTLNDKAGTHRRSTAATEFVADEGEDRVEQPVAAPPSGNPRVKDARGRVFELRKPSLLAQFDIYQAVGGEVASNQSWMLMFMPLLTIASIDGEPVAMPKNMIQARALINEVGDDGYAAVVDGLKEHFGENTEDLKAQVKNS